MFLILFYFSAFGGPPDPLHGNIPYLLVRKAAKVRKSRWKNVLNINKDLFCMIFMV